MGAAFAFAFCSLACQFNLKVRILLAGAYLPGSKEALVAETRRQGILGGLKDAWPEEASIAPAFTVSSLTWAIVRTDFDKIPPERARQGASSIASRIQRIGYGSRGRSSCVVTQQFSWPRTVARCVLLGRSSEACKEPLRCKRVERRLLTESCKSQLPLPCTSIMLCWVVTLTLACGMMLYDL